MNSKRKQSKNFNLNLSFEDSFKAHFPNWLWGFPLQKTAILKNFLVLNICMHVYNIKASERAKQEQGKLSFNPRFKFRKTFFGSETGFAFSENFQFKLIKR